MGVEPIRFPVHPHACGEHDLNEAFVSGMSGSSPRLWGTFIEDKDIPINTRFIPTPVGNICADDVIQHLFAVHPHACGEHEDEDIPVNAFYGSSPRLWGTCYCIRARHQ